MVAYKNKTPIILEIGTKDFVLSPIKMCASDNLVFVLKTSANGKD
jgi:hypothetical protein